MKILIVFFEYKMRRYNPNISIVENEQLVINNLLEDHNDERYHYIVEQLETLKNILTDEGYILLLQYYWSDLYYTDYPVLHIKFNFFFTKVGVNYLIKT